MFDANMRHLPKGTKFFAKCHYYQDNELGLKKGDVYLCEMLTQCNENPFIIVRLDSGIWHSLTNETDFYDKLFTYEGNIDLTDFISDESKQKAENLLNKQSLDI